MREGKTREREEEEERERERGRNGGSFPTDDEVALLLSLNTTRGS